MRIWILFGMGFLASYGSLSGQGCSDAGLCTLESFKHMEDSAKTANHTLQLGGGYGRADYQIAAYNAFVSYQLRLTEKWLFETRITFLTQDGNDISTSGVSDIFINANRNLGDVRFGLGFKIPTNTANKSLDGLPLPMDYQSSLGTLDLLINMSYSLKRWSFFVGSQIPLTQNENAFYSELYPEDSPLFNVQSTNGFTRKSDLLARISYTLSIGEKWLVVPSLLPIYHVSNDSFVNLDGNEQYIYGSKGLTLNGTLSLQFVPSEKQKWELVLASPFIVRDSRPDGLTRSVLFGVSYSFSF
jgi:hypothetical protein